MKYKAVIFDLDGVICHTDRSHYLAWKKLADSLNIPFDEQINNRLRGVSRLDSLDIILEKSTQRYTDNEKKAFAEEKNKVYQELLNSMTPEDLPMDSKDTLDKLKNMGIRIAIGSSSRNAVLILSRLGLSDYFDVIVDGTQITNAKPDPEVFLLAARKLAVEPKDALVIEDALSGITAAVAGGFDTVGLGDAANLEMADYTIHRLSDIINIIEKEQ